jgi:FKBP-type peptidyl-prolyl cis-trans isomerase FklB
MRAHCIVLYASVFIALASSSVQTASSQQESPKLETTRDQASYAIGLNIARDVQANGLNAEALIAGIRDVLASAEPKLTAEQCRAALAQFDQQLRAQRDQLRRITGQRNKEQGTAFLAQNGKQEGVVTLPSGLQYKVLKSGSGPSPTIRDTVRTHYHGTLIDGTVFDSSVERNEPITLQVGDVIRGWTEALQLMKVGDKWRLYVPPELGYGSQGAGDAIGPGAVLIFEVELLGIE